VTENSELDYFQVILRIMPRAQQQANWIFLAMNIDWLLLLRKANWFWSPR
jgi:hypothetical protein